MALTNAEKQRAYRERKQPKTQVQKWTAQFRRLVGTREPHLIDRMLCSWAADAPAPAKGARTKAMTTKMT